MLSEKRRRLKEVAYRCSCARAEVQVIAGDRNHQNVAGVFAECVKVSLAAAPLLIVITGEIRFLAKDVFGSRGFFKMISKTLSLVTGSLIALIALFDLLLQVFIFIQGDNARRLAALEVDVDIGSSANCHGVRHARCWIHCAGAGHGPCSAARRIRFGNPCVCIGAIP